MKKILTTIFAATFVLAVISSLGAFSLNNNDSNMAIGNCGYGSTYLGYEYCPAGYVSCYGTDGKVFREIGICSTITWGGCTEDECNPPCYAVMPD
ncbi:MAG: hypothetical protein U9N54_04485 [candidate division Zixibacteria bacterium]|nr:hypothetical protein [candidate division Zixibacteria bacterium]